MRMKNPIFRAMTGLCCLGAALAMASPADATTIVWLDPAEPLVTSVGGTVEVDLWANFSEPIVGWGLDVGFSNPAVTSAPSVDLGTAWDAPGGTLDGDGLAGFQFPPGVTGDVLLATLTFAGVDAGATSLILGYDGSDEGFMQPTSDLDLDITYMPATLTVVPEPVACVLLGVFAVLSLRRRR